MGGSAPVQRAHALGGSLRCSLQTTGQRGEREASYASGQSDALAPAALLATSAIAYAAVAGLKRPRATPGGQEGRPSEYGGAVLAK